MSANPIQNNLHSQSSGPRVLRIRDEHRTASLGLMVGGLSVLLLSLITHLQKGADFSAWFYAAGYSLAFLSIGFGGRWFRGLNGLMQIYPSWAEMKTNGKDETLNFEEIAKIEFFFFPWFFAKYRIKTKNGKTFWFGDHWQRNDYLLDALYHYNPGLFSDRKFDNFRAWLVTCDFQWTRLTDRLRNRNYLLFKYVGFPFLISVVLIALSEPISPMTAFVSFVLFTTYGIGISQAIYAVLGLGLIETTWIQWKDRKRIKKRPFDLKRDLNFERKLHRAFEIFFYSTTLFFYTAITLLLQFNPV